MTETYVKSSKPIACGDQLQYELDNANIPPEQRSDWPLPSFSAQDWAVAFNKKHPSVSVDDARAWMACALMRGYDEGRTRVAHETRAHPEHRCERCRGPNVRWFAPSPLWNAAHGEWDILCPICFVQLAEAAGIDPTAWEVRPEVLPQETTTATEEPFCPMCENEVPVAQVGNKVYHIDEKHGSRRCLKSIATVKATAPQEMQRNPAYCVVHNATDCPFCRPESES